MSGKIVKVSGPLVVATGLEDANMADVVRVGEQRLIGEILTMNGDSASIQVYEETSGLGPGAAVESTGSPLSVELGPGIIENIYDGIQRPLEVIMKQTGKNTLERGVEVPALDREKLWDFVPVAKPGDKVTGGDILGTVQETAVVLHKIMVPPRLSGTVESIQAGKFNVTQTVAVLKKDDGSKVELTMTQKWPVRVGRIANTSDMPVAAREASIYTGITIAEYFRDMGYHVAVIADSTSRWAEALREMSGRLEEMPGEEGYPAYLSSRLAQFYERAGMVECLGSDDERRGSLTAVGAVSPPGGDLSEPVSQAPLRIVKVFWALDASLAYRRHFPAINWVNSYSLYLDSLKPWFDEHLGKEFLQNRERAMNILQEEASLNEIVQLVGKDALSPNDQLTLETAKMLREDFLQQNSFMDIDNYSSYDRQEKLMAMILEYDKLCRAAIAKGAAASALFDIPARERIGRAKSVPEAEYPMVYEAIRKDMADQIDAAAAKGGEF